MKILYLSDNYAANVSGTKISLFREMQRRNFDIVWKDVHSAGSNKTDGKNLLSTLQAGKFTDLWISHTWTEFVGCTRSDINKLGVKVLGFGFSDPYEWNGDKLQQYDLYATNHLDTFFQLQKRIPVHYFATACNVDFHKRLGTDRTTDILVFGQGEHPRFSPPKYRIAMLQGLMSVYKDKSLKVFGSNWHAIPHAPAIEGNVFLTEINKAKLSLDLQQPHAPLAHRMFECMACGTLTITRDRPEARKIFGLDTDLLFYTDLDDLKKKITFLLSDGEVREKLANVMYNKVRTNHSITNRVDSLLQFLREQKRI